MNEEKWQSIKEFPHYEISSHGRVRNKIKGNLLSIKCNYKGFPIVVFYAQDSTTRILRQVNQLVAEAFLPQPIEDKMTAVWHVDGDLQNCRADNLRWEFRNRVLEWNDQNRLKEPKYKTPRVRNNRTGTVYDNAYSCAVAEGELESTIVWKVEKGSPRYSYISEKDM